MAKILFNNALFVMNLVYEKKVLRDNIMRRDREGNIMGIPDPETYKISIADRRRYLVALKRVLDEFYPTVVEGGDIVGDHKWEEDEWGNKALVKLFVLLGGSQNVRVDYSINNFFRADWEKIHSGNQKEKNATK